jgi:two-component system sensor histidine kinase UhpB
MPSGCFEGGSSGPDRIRVRDADTTRDAITCSKKMSAPPATPPAAETTGTPPGSAIGSAAPAVVAVGGASAGSQCRDADRARPGSARRRETGRRPHGAEVGCRALRMTTRVRMSDRRRAYIPLFWRLFVPNASVLIVACVVLWIEPANGRIIALAGGLVLMIVFNVVLMRRAFAPLARLTATMHSIDPLQPGQRIAATGPASEVTVLTEAFNAMLDRVETERRESARRALQAQEEERRYLTTELHDEIGQTLTALSLELQHVSATVARNGDDPLATAKDATTQAIGDVRRLARRLRPEVLDELGLVAALTNLCDRLSATSGLRVERQFEQPLPELDAATELVVYRIAQESLTNVIRHARARTAAVVLRGAGEALELRVRDDGVGLSEATQRAGGTGIRGMRERAIAVGASLSVTARAQGGTEVRLLVAKTSNGR